MPDELLFIGAVTGALLPLTEADNWEQFGTMTPAEAASIMSDMFETFVESDCEGQDCPPPNVAGVRIIRINPTTGKFEELADDAETWQEPTGDYAVPDIEARSEPTQDERECAAAANAANVMHQLYLETLDMWENAIAPLAAFEQFGELGGELANAALSVLLGAYAPFVGAAWGIFYATMDILTAEIWSEDFEASFVCLLKENAVYTDGVVTFNYGGVTTGLFSTEFLRDTDIVLLGQVSYLLGIIGADGLNLSGEATAVEGDCTACETWCYEFDYTAGQGGIAGVTVYDQNGSAFCGGGSTGSWNSNGWSLVRSLGRSFTRTIITDMECDVTAYTGTGTPKMGVEFYDPQGGRSYDRDYANMSTQSNNTGSYTLTWSGWVNASQLSFIRCTTTGTTTITRLLLRGRGANPFGTDNC